MKIERLSIILSSALSLSFSSCKKDNNNSGITFPKKLYVSELTQKGAIKVYTANGEITDAAVITKFLGQQQSYFNQTLTPGDTSSLKFVDGDNATFGSLSAKFAVTYNNSQFLFTSPQFVTPLSPTDIPYLLLKYPPPLTPVPNGSGQQYLSNEVRVAYGDYNSLKLSILSYKLTSRTGTSYRTDAAVLYNEFNSAVISKLKANDTLAVQESLLTLKSK